MDPRRHHAHVEPADGERSDETSPTLEKAAAANRSSRVVREQRHPVVGYSATLGSSTISYFLEAKALALALRSRMYSKKENSFALAPAA